MMGVNGQTQPNDPAAMLSTALPFADVTSEAVLSYDRTASIQLGRDYWRLLKNLKFYVGSPEDNRWVLVPEGFLTDGATIPRALYWLIPPWGKYGHATVIHDYLCEYGRMHHAFETVPVSRKQADEIFLQALRVAKVDPIRRGLMYCGVSFYRWYIGVFGDKTPDSYRILKRSLDENYRP